jgi:branched-chain amino acid transport system permease protein
MPGGSDGFWAGLGRFRDAVTRRWPRWLPAEYALLVLAALFPLQPLGVGFGGQLTQLFVFAIVALGLNVVLGYTGLLHLGIAGFFGIGAYTAAILTIKHYPFQLSFFPAVLAATAAAGAAGLVLGAPTLRLKGDYLALVTLGFGEVVRVCLRNFEQITNGTRTLNPVPPPSLPGGWGADLNWTGQYRWFYYLALALLALVVVLLRNLERSRLGRAWVAIREDELAATCMGINAPRAKLAAFAVGAALAGLAGALFATKLMSSAEPNQYNFDDSIAFLCCIILGGLGSIRGTLLGVALLMGFDRILSNEIDQWLQDRLAGTRLAGSDWFEFTSWRMMLFGLALIVMMRFRPEGLWPSARVKEEMHETRSAL